MTRTLSFNPQARSEIREAATYYGLESPALRDAFLDADSNDLGPVDPQLLRQLLGRQVVRHLAPSPGTKKPACALRADGSVDYSDLVLGRNQGSCLPERFIVSKNSG